MPGGYAAHPGGCPATPGVFASGRIGGVAYCAPVRPQGYSALAGAAFLVLCDTLGRVLLAPVEIRVGIMTAIIGAPYFLYLLRRLRAGNGI